MTLHSFNLFLIAMALVAVVVFVALFFVDAGYGKFYHKKWGPAVNNRIGWVLMESPVFVAMLLLWLFSARSGLGPGTDGSGAGSLNITTLVFLLLFEAHYFQRSFVFPFLIRGNGRMPLSIILMGLVFNTLNALMQGGWLFYLSPADRYTLEWLSSPQFIIGTLIFFAGMFINMQSDYIIRHLRKPGDTRHYLPKGGMFKYVSSANYYGELVEWFGFAVLTWSWSGVVFVVWTFANLAPRAVRIHKRYKEEFGSEFNDKKIKSILPFIF